MKPVIALLSARFEMFLKGKGYREKTVKGYRYALNVFSRYLSAGQKEDLREVSTADILRYHADLTDELKRYTASSASRMMGSVHVFFSYLVRHSYILKSPFDGLDLRARTRDTLRESMSEKDLECLLDTKEPKDAIEERDRMLFEFLYGTGLRIGEASSLLLTDIDMQSGRVFVRSGKGGKDRIVPIGKALLEKLRIYVTHTRVHLMKEAKRKSEHLFFNRYGMRMGNSAIQRAFKRRLKRSGLDETKYCPHMIRHSFATHLLEHGAGVKQVKELLGHESIQTTVGYTHFSVSNLKRIVKRYHPGENELYRELGKDERAKYEEILRNK